MEGYISVTMAGGHGAHWGGPTGTAVAATLADAAYHLAHGVAPDGPLDHWQLDMPRGLREELPVGSEYQQLWFSADWEEEIARRFAGLIEHYGTVRALPVRAAIVLSPVLPTPRADGQGEDCWECGCPIAHHDGVIDALGWAHRSCVGA